MLFDNVDRLLDSIEMLTYALEHPNDRGNWFLSCNEDLPVCDTLFPELCAKHFSHISMSAFCKEPFGRRDRDCFEKFEDDCLLHFRQLNADQIFSVHKKLLFALECLKTNLEESMAFSS